MSSKWERTTKGKRKKLAYQRTPKAREYQKWYREQHGDKIKDYQEEYRKKLDKEALRKYHLAYYYKRKKKMIKIICHRNHVFRSKHILRQSICPKCNSIKLKRYDQEIQGQESKTTTPQHKECGDNEIRG